MTNEMAIIDPLMEYNLEWEFFRKKWWNFIINEMKKYKPDKKLLKLGIIWMRKQ